MTVSYEAIGLVIDTRLSALPFESKLGELLVWPAGDYADERRRKKLI